MTFDKHHNHLTLIPFGQRTSDQRLVDVSEVPQGLACGCVCPSCKAPLMARQGNVLQWHFAHSGKGTEAQAVQQCEYSFYFSVALMARQMFLECRGLVLPDYVYTRVEKGRWTHASYEASVILTRGRRITPDRCVLGRQVAGHAVDVLCEVEGVPLAIVLDRPDKRCGLSAADFDGHRVGVVRIDLLETLRLFRNRNGNRKTERFHRALERFLFERRDTKQWIYHPRQEVRIQALMEELQARVEREERPFRERVERERRQLAEEMSETRRRERSGSREQARQWTGSGAGESATDLGDGRKSPMEPVVAEPLRSRPSKERGEPVRYECVLCEHRWTGTRQGLNPCPKCGSHLYRRELKGES